LFFSLFHQHQQRIFVERLFYLVLNNVELTHFSTFNANSIINISKELEKYQHSTNKTILNTGKLNTVIQFVLSFSSSSISSFQLNNLFYLLLNDMNDFSGKIIDRIAELLRAYHSMTYGHTITKQYLITTVREFREYRAIRDRISLKKFLRQKHVKNFLILCSEIKKKQVLY